MTKTWHTIGKPIKQPEYGTYKAAVFKDDIDDEGRPYKKTIATIIGKDSDEVAKTAALIAGAPQMYEALDTARFELEGLIRLAWSISPLATGAALEKVHRALSKVNGA